MVLRFFHGILNSISNPGGLEMGLKAVADTRALTKSCGTVDYRQARHLDITPM